MPALFEKNKSLVLSISYVKTEHAHVAKSFFFFTNMVGKEEKKHAQCSYLQMSWSLHFLVSLYWLFRNGLYIGWKGTAHCGQCHTGWCGFIPIHVGTGFGATKAVCRLVVTAG